MKPVGIQQRRSPHLFSQARFAIRPAAARSPAKAVAISTYWLCDPAIRSLQPEIQQRRAAEPRRVRVPFQHNRRHAHPQRVADRRVAVERKRVQGDVDLVVQPQIFVPRPLVDDLARAPDRCPRAPLHPAHSLRTDPGHSASTISREFGVDSRMLRPGCNASGRQLVDVIERGEGDVPLVERRQLR